MQMETRAVVAIFVSDETDFKTKSIKNNKEEHYLMIKGLI